MRDPSDTELLELGGWTLRVRAGDDGPHRQLALIHGWTGDENSMWIFARRLPRDYWIVAPRAPHRGKPSGFSWRGSSHPGRALPTLDDFKPAIERLLSMLDALAADRGLTSRTWSLMGFSQGAAVAACIALLYPQRIDRLALLAGFVPIDAERLAAQAPLLGKQVFVAHGSQDEMVDIEVSRRAVRLLEAAGASVQLCEDDVGHKVSARCLNHLETFFA